MAIAQRKRKAKSERVKDPLNRTWHIRNVQNFCCQVRHNEVSLDILFSCSFRPGALIRNCNCSLIVVCFLPRASGSYCLFQQNIFINQLQQKNKIKHLAQSFDLYFLLLEMCVGAFLFFLVCTYRKQFRMLVNIYSHCCRARILIDFSMGQCFGIVCLALVLHLIEIH